MNRENILEFMEASFLIIEILILYPDNAELVDIEKISESLRKVQYLLREIRK